MESGARRLSTVNIGRRMPKRYKMPRPPPRPGRNNRCARNPSSRRSRLSFSPWFWGLLYGFHAVRKSATALAVLTQERAEGSLSLQRKERAPRLGTAGQGSRRLRRQHHERRPAPDGRSQPSRPAGRQPEVVRPLPEIISLQPVSALRPFYRAFGFSQEKIDRFEEISTTGEAERLDLQAVTEAEGMSPSDPGILALRQQQREEGQAAFLHDFGVRATMEIRRQAPGALGRGDHRSRGRRRAEVHGLSGPQTSALLQILQNSSPSYQAGVWPARRASIGPPLPRRRGRSFPVPYSKPSRREPNRTSSIASKTPHAQQPAAVQ